MAFPPTGVAVGAALVITQLVPDVDTTVCPDVYPGVELIPQPAARPVLSFNNKLVPV